MEMKLDIKWIIINIKLEYIHMIIIIILLLYQKNPNTNINLLKRLTSKWTWTTSFLWIMYENAQNNKEQSGPCFIDWRKGCNHVPLAFGERKERNCIFPMASKTAENGWVANFDKIHDWYHNLQWFICDFFFPFQNKVWNKTKALGKR